MVLQHAHSFSAVSSPRLDVARIAAGAGAIALNVAVLLLLLIPAGLPDLAAPSDRGMVVVPIVDRIIPPKPPVPVPVVKPVTPVAPATPAPVRPDIVQPVVEQVVVDQGTLRSEEHTSELQSLMRNSYDVFCLKKKNINKNKEISYTVHIHRNSIPTPLL